MAFHQLQNAIDTNKVIKDALYYADEISNNLSLFIRDSVSLEGLSTEGGEMIVYKNQRFICQIAGGKELWRNGAE